VKKMLGNQGYTTRSHDSFPSTETARVRSMTELYLLRAAQAAAENARKFRASNHWMEELTATVSAVILAQAVIEGYFHAFLEACLQPRSRKQEFEGVMTIHPLEEKVKTGLQLATGKAVDKGTQPWQDFHLLREIRNALVHYRPIWESSESEPVHVLKSVQTTRRFALRDERSRWEEKLLTADCATWALQTAVSMVQFFYNFAGLSGYPAGIRDVMSTDTHGVTADNNAGQTNTGYGEDQ